MAVLASSREGRRYVVWICGAGIRCLVAGVAVGGYCGVVVVDVATGARRGSVCAGQGKRAGTVVESARRPRRGGVAKIAGLRIARRHMVWVRGAVEVG